MTQEQKPVNTSRYWPGTGIWVSQLDGYGQTPTMLGRYTIRDPDTLDGADLGLPLYQFNLVQAPVANLEDYWAIIHGVDVLKFVAKPLQYGVSPNLTPPPFTMVDQIGAVGLGTAAAAVLHTPTDQVCLIWNEPDLFGSGDALTLQFFLYTGVPYVSGAPIVTGLDLGFTPQQIQTNQWLTWVATLLEDGNIAVLGATWDYQPQQIGEELQGPLTFQPRFRMWRFVIDPTVGAGGAASVVEQAVEVEAPVPFMPHQIAFGKDQPLNGQPRRNLAFCSGVVDTAYFYYQTILVGGSIGEYSVTARQTLAPAIWVSDDPVNLTNWKLVWQSSAGRPDNPAYSSPGVFGGFLGDLPISPTGDFGLTFDEAWQRLTMHGVDDDPSQDPMQDRYGGAGGGGPELG